MKRGRTIAVALFALALGLLGAFFMFRQHAVNGESARAAASVEADKAVRKQPLGVVPDDGRGESSSGHGAAIAAQTAKPEQRCLSFQQFGETESHRRAMQWFDEMGAFLSVPYAETYSVDMLRQMAKGGDVAAMNALAHSLAYDYSQLQEEEKRGNRKMLVEARDAFYQVSVNGKFLTFDDVSYMYYIEYDELVEGGEKDSKAAQEALEQALLYRDVVERLIPRYHSIWLTSRPSPASDARYQAKLSALLARIDQERLANGLPILRVEPPAEYFEWWGVRECNREARAATESAHAKL